jgi:lipopolysaccharide biosynthesis protein
MRLIALYLPQYHPIPENDQWWGMGFTEWTNVARAQPRFKGHYQPHLPADLGFYDLRLPEARQAQAELAEGYGIYGFCYYHYWFNGRRVLQRPFEEVLASGQPDFPFCLCWANENWTRAWDGGDRHILLSQDYTPEDDLAHIRSLLPALEDRRYIRIKDRPLLLVYRTELLPDAARTAEIWREAARSAGIGEIYLARMESFATGINPAEIGFDAAVEFAPDWRAVGRGKHHSRKGRVLGALRLVDRGYGRNRVTEYGELVARMLAKKEAAFTQFRCVTPGFDNSPRRAQDAVIFANSSPEAYRNWLAQVIDRTRQRFSDPDEQIVFLNAWNEWGEGNHLQPDQKWGRAYLEATQWALRHAAHE